MFDATSALSGSSVSAWHVARRFGTSIVQSTASPCEPPALFVEVSFVDVTVIVTLMMSGPLISIVLPCVDTLVAAGWRTATPSDFTVCTGHFAGGSTSANAMTLRASTTAKTVRRPRRERMPVHYHVCYGGA